MQAEPTAATLGAALSKMLSDKGVDTIFGIPGVHNIELYRGIEDTGITHVLARNEMGAGFMADGYARATGRPGVAFVITGPGLTNIMTPMGQAYSDRVPMLVISSCLPPQSRTPGQLHQMRDQVGAAATVCDWSELAIDADAAFDLVERAFDEFAAGSNRPKHIAIPIDVLAAPVAPPESTPSRVPAPLEPSPGELDALAARVDAATHPLFIFGGGAARASEAAREVLRKSGAASFTSYAGRGIPAMDDPLGYGATLARPDSAHQIAKADLVVVVGCELAEVDLWRGDLGHTGELVRVDTDETVLNDIHCADVKIRADAGVFLQGLAPRLTPSSPRWSAPEIARARTAFRAETIAETPGIAPFADALRKAVPDDTQIYSDMTQFAYVSKEILSQPVPGHWHHPYGFGTLGYGLPAAIGGKIASGEAPVLVIVGDSGFQYTMQELGVAAELGLGLPIVLWDNEKLKEIEEAMIRAQIAPNAVTARNPDFEALAKSYDIHYAAPENPEDFGAALAQAFDNDRPTLVHLCAQKLA